MPIKIDNEEFLTSREAQEFLGVSIQSLGNYVKAGKLKRYERELASNIKYYKRSELQKLLEFRPETDQPE